LESPFRMGNDNVFLKEIYAVLPRIFGLIDSDPFSPTYGLGDRLFWSWKIIDFPNGSYQGYANGLSRLLKHNLLPYQIDQGKIIDRIEASFLAVKRILRPNGSLEEALPYESSFCVTALVAYDLLTAIENQTGFLKEKDKQEFLEIIAPLIHFLMKNDETHGFISNHLATAAAALFKWNKITGEKSEEIEQKFLNRLLNAMDSEGWFPEYEGADPGYQTLCLNYLADIYQMSNNPQILDALKTSVNFLWNFAHPDGSFSGIYGSRQTRIFYPGGIEFISEWIPQAEELSQFMKKSFASQKTILLSAIDEPNLIPLFNSFAWAAETSHLNKNKEKKGNNFQIPALRPKYQKDFPHAGLFIRSDEEKYLVISAFKGGSFLMSEKKTGKVLVNGGPLFRDIHGKIYGSQPFSNKNKFSQNGNKFHIESRLTQVGQPLPTPLKFIILRVLSLTVFRIKIIREVIKKYLVKLLIIGKKPLGIVVNRTIKIDDNGVQFKDEVKPPHDKKFEPISIMKEYSTIHMASRGYWQIQDDQ